jgi:[NiFe] hydrogenase diaphorase moiety small subunit
VVKVNGRTQASCTTPAAGGQVVESEVEEITSYRRAILQMLFVEGNHICPACEKSGACQLQAVAYYVGMLDPHFTHFFPKRRVDASHPDVMIDFNRCILCELCVRASRDVDGKGIFAISGRGIKAQLVVSSPSGRLGDTDFRVQDKAAHVCPVGAILPKHRGYEVPIGNRLYDRQPISVVGDVAANEEKTHA